MMSRRSIGQLVILLLLVSILIVLLPGVWNRLQIAPAQQPPLPGTNSVSGLRLAKDADGTWTAEFDYFYTGAPANARARVGLWTSSPASGEPVGSSYLYRLERGASHARLELNHPAGHGSATTRHIAVQILGEANAVLAREDASQTIEWPDWGTWARQRELARKTPDQLAAMAINLIDVGDEHSLAEAKRLLERLIAKNPKSVTGYVEMARVSMKANWGPDGLRHAEQLLRSALQIEPDSANAKILLGYVLVHQGRDALAEALFVEAAKSNTPNLWLWANWGELLARQGKTTQAIEKYREAVTRPRTHDTYDRARLDAYRSLLALHEGRKEYGPMETLYKQRVQEFGTDSCHAAEYAASC
jgi:tetratricopeptide (TPR) repeat protein